MAVFLFVLDWRCQSLLFISPPLFVLLLKTPHQRVVFRSKEALLRHSAHEQDSIRWNYIKHKLDMWYLFNFTCWHQFSRYSKLLENSRFPSRFVDVRQFPAGSNVIPERISINCQEWEKSQKMGPKMTIQSKMGDFLIWELLGLHQLFL